MLFGRLLNGWPPLRSIIGVWCQRNWWFWSHDKDKINNVNNSFNSANTMHLNDCLTIHDVIMFANVKVHKYGPDSITYLCQIHWVCIIWLFLLHSIFLHRMHCAHFLASFEQHDENLWTSFHINRLDVWERLCIIVARGPKFLTWQFAFFSLGWVVTIGHCSLNLGPSVVRCKGGMTFCPEGQRRDLKHLGWWALISPPRQTQAFLCNLQAVKHNLARWQGVEGTGISQSKGGVGLRGDGV